jgi:prophage tail gpP-like protein
MPTDNITLTVGGYECKHWDEVSIDSDLEIPADAWSLTLFNPPENALPPAVKIGAVIDVSYRNQPILKGVIDRIPDVVNRQGHRLAITGRDVVGVLLDNSVPLTVQQKVTLADIVGKYIAEFSSIVQGLLVDKGIDYATAKTAVEPAESIWSAVVRAAEAAGQYIWAEPNGALHIGNPFNGRQPPIPTLYLNRDGSKNNVLSAEYTEDIADLYSQVIVLGQDNQTHRSFYATEENTDQTYDGQDLTPSKKDQPDTPEYTGKASQRLPYTRRKITLEALADNNDQASNRAKKIMQDGNLHAYTLTVSVVGWTCSTGQVWQTGWTVHYHSDITRPAANGDWVIFGRTLRLSRQTGKTTELRLRRKQYWMQPIAPVEQPDAADPATEEMPDA